MSAEDLEHLGLDPSAPDAEDTERLVRHLLEQGAETDELQEAIRTGTTGPLALDLALRGRQGMLPFVEASERAGVDPSRAADTWRALGFPDPLAAGARLTDSEARALALLDGMGRAMMGDQTGSQLARVIGSSLAQTAEAVVDAYRVRVEMPRRRAGESHADVVSDYAAAVPNLLAALDEAMQNIFRAHLLAVARGSWALDESQAAVTRQLTIGFADLVGYTRSAHSQSPAELASGIDRFETLVGEVASGHGGRVVKLIGDEAMLALPAAEAACRLARELRASIQADPQLPPVRIGLAAGPVVGLRGDYYGDVVNLAARLVQVADPNEVVVSAAVADAVSAAIDLEPLELPPLKGYDEPVVAFRLTT